VLAGDYLLASAAGLIAELDEPTLLRVLTDALRAMCAGEIQQMFSHQGRHRSRDEYYRAIDAKTASLCAAATEMAARLAGATEVQAGELHRYGRELGLAFQIADDVLDFIGDEHALGKPAGSDLRQGIVTLPVLWYLEHRGGDDLVQAVLAGECDATQARAAIEAVRQSGAIEAALDEARTHAELSQKALASLPDNDARRILHALASLVVERSR
jgi:geranylgeranyl pyrophosphate synthase